MRVNLEGKREKDKSLLNKISLFFCLWVSGVIFGYAWAMMQ